MPLHSAHKQFSAGIHFHPFSSMRVHQQCLAVASLVDRGSLPHAIILTLFEPAEVEIDALVYLPGDELLRSFVHFVL
jgi:hypothetical protein